jgi:hypothetical protein
MKIPRFTIRSLLLVISFVGVAVAALRASTGIWDGCLLGLTALGLLTSVLLAVHGTNRRRAFWLGFVLFGWAYLVASLIPAIGPRLPTTKGLALIDSKIPWRERNPVTAVQAVASITSSPAATNPVQGFVVPPLLFASPQGDVWVWDTTTGRLLSGPNGSTEDFIRIGHSLLALLLAFSGGHLSRHLYEQGRGESPIPPSNPSTSAWPVESVT